jgi:hypothetical protein
MEIGIMTKIVLFILFVVFIVLIGPLLTIWALNTLFPVIAIPYSLETWAATVLIGAFLRANVSVKQ